MLLRDVGACCGVEATQGFPPIGNPELDLGGLDRELELTSLRAVRIVIGARNLNDDVGIPCLIEIPGCPDQGALDLVTGLVAGILPVLVHVSCALLVLLATLDDS